MRSEAFRITKASQLTDPFIAAGHRAYVVGTQDGGFPPRGFHRQGEMSGVWAHPLKLLDGFWLAVDGEWLPPATAYTSEAFSAVQRFDLPGELRIDRCQFVPDGEPAVIVSYSLHSPVDRVVSLCFLARTDLRLAWSPRQSERAGQDEARFRDDLGAWECWNAFTGGRLFLGAVGRQPNARERGRDMWGTDRTGGDGISVSLEYSLHLDAGCTALLEVVVAAGEGDDGTASDVFLRVRERTSDLWNTKARRYEDFLERSRVTLPDSAIEQACEWLKCSYDWLDLEVEGLGRGLAGGLEEYPWWFGCDAGYAVLGALVLGRQDIGIRTLDLLREASLRANGRSGRVIHECTTRDEVINPGNVEETPLFVSGVWQTYLWSGDRDFLQRHYDFCRRGLLGWVLGEQAGADDLLPFGYGITERLGLDLQCIDVAAYTARALNDLRDMAETVGDEGTARDCAELAARVTSQLEQHFWIEDEGMYGDMIATPAEMEPRLRAWLQVPEGIYYESGATERAALAALLQETQRTAHDNIKRPWLLKHWVVITPLEIGLAATDRALRVLDRVQGPEFTGRYGMYLSSMDRTHTMSVNTGALAVAEATYGRVEKAVEYMRIVAHSLEAGMPGAISEMLPDYGCFVQAWSGYAVAWPLVTYIFGVRPDAGRKRLVIDARLPSGWTNASLAGLRIGQCTFDMRWDGEVMHVRASEDGWSITSPGVPVQVETGQSESVSTS